MEMKGSKGLVSMEETAKEQSMIKVTKACLLYSWRNGEKNYRAH